MCVAWLSTSFVVSPFCKKESTMEGAEAGDDAATALCPRPPRGAGAEEETGGFLAGFEHVDVGVGVIADDGVGEGDHALGEVGVEVEGEEDGLGGAEDFAGCGEDGTFDIVFADGGLGSVHSEEEGVGVGFGEMVGEVVL